MSLFLILEFVLDKKFQPNVLRLLTYDQGTLEEDIKEHELKCNKERATLDFDMN